MEGVLAAMFAWRPKQETNDAHHQHLVEIVPRLDDHLVEATVVPDAEETLSVGGVAHQELVVETAHRANQRANHDQPHPDGMFGRDALLAARHRDESEGHDGDDDAGPLPTIELLAKDEDGAQQCQDGTGGIDGRSNGDGEVLQPIVGTYPGSQDDGRLEDDVEVYDGVLDAGDVEEAVTVDMSGGREYHEGQEDAGTEESVEQQDRNDGIVLETYLLEYIIDAQEHGAQKGKENPHTLVRCAHANIRCAHVNVHFVHANTNVLILAGARVKCSLRSR